METFLCLTSLEWTALGAIATFGVSLIALFLPMFQEWKKYNKMVELIQKELEDNLDKIINASKVIDSKIQTPQGNENLLKINIQIAIIEHLSLKHWNDFKYEIALKRPKFYEKSKETILLIESLISKYNDIAPPHNKGLSSFLFQKTINDIASQESK